MIERLMRIIISLPCFLFFVALLLRGFVGGDIILLGEINIYQRFACILGSFPFLIFAVIIGFENDRRRTEK